MARNTRTKSQRRRDNERRRKGIEERFDKQMGPRPPGLDELVADFGGGNLLGPIPKTDGWERAPLHMVQYGEHPKVDPDKQANISKKASEWRTEERDQRIVELRLRYPQHWGTWGAAKFIAGSETDAGNPMSERTVQKYFKITGD